mmetsp:Transcript_67534/g.152834  ORF Transcript_67534/g.152834 Transcript_67534/m.152834 type:complete len:207 (+) Transcript_67534:594-1214(+)
MHVPLYFGRTTARNVFRQLNSLMEVTKLWDAYSRELQGGAALDEEYYRAVVYLRPDLRYIGCLEAPKLLALGNEHFMTPSWSTWGGCNDRMAAGGARVMRAFGTRLNLVGGYLFELEVTSLALNRRADQPRQKARSPGDKYHHGVHPESFLRWVMLKHHGFKRVKFDLRGLRVRASGAIDRRDWSLVERGEWAALHIRNGTLPDLP